ncbi:MAG TPA: polyprenyl synthetase family protein [Candidatus Dormibacteraeota bacterium]
MSELFGPVTADLAELEERLRRSFADDPDSAAGPMADLFAAGGKRLRPALLLLAANLGRYDFEHLAPAAMAVELVHAATLVHDDVIDRAATRRGRPTVAASAGAEAAIVIGDHYFAKAYREASRTGDAAVVEELAHAVMLICAGELEQQAERWSWRVDHQRYLRRIEGKTAVLLAAACRVGGRLGGLDRDGQQALGRYGTALGLAFQIADDVLDYTGTEAELGKPVGQDLREGMATLPLLLSPGAADHLIDGSPPDPATATEVIAAVRAGPGPERALAEARRHAAEAEAALERFGQSEAAAALRALAAYVVARRL